MGALKVLLLGLNYAPEPTGIAPYTTATARFLAEAGHDVHVVTGLPHYPYWKVADGYRGPRMHETDGQVRVTRVWHPVPAVPTGRSRITAELAFAMHAAAAGGRRPDVVLAVSPALLTVAAALRWRLPGRTAVGAVVQDLYSRAVAEAGVLGGRGARSVRQLERRLLGGCDGVVAIHDTFADSLAGIGVDRDKVSVIRNWTHTRPCDGDPRAFRRSMGWGDDETIALHAGNMGAKQGLENVVEAARLADARRLPLRFVLLGAGNQRADLERRAVGIERLQFLDPLPTGPFETALAAADMLVLNERPEVAEMCVPSKLTSYFAAGRAVVAATSSRSATTLEVAASGGGVCVAPGEPGTLLEAASSVGANPAGAMEMGERGAEYARSVLSADAARASYVGWVENLGLGPRGHAVGERLDTAPSGAVAFRRAFTRAYDANRWQGSQASMIRESGLG